MLINSEQMNKIKENVKRFEEIRFLPSFKSTVLLVQEKKRKIDFQDGGHDSHLRFPIGTILAIFYLQVTPTLPTKI